MSRNTTLFRFTILFIIYINPAKSSRAEADLIYILQWSYSANESWIYWFLEMGQESFVSRNCSFQNCYITANRSYFDSIVDFDVLLFNAVHIRLNNYQYDLPRHRSEVQLYVFAAGEPALYYPLTTRFNNVFNVTWTYKLDSDLVHTYFVIKNEFNQIIGPKRNMRWVNINDLPPTNTSIVQKLQSKRIAAAWIVTNCVSTARIDFANKLKYELSKFGHQIDVYGSCGNLSCPKIPTERNGLLTKCYTKIESDYYFYLAFENSISEDYITEKVLHGLHHYTVPVVFGGADYTRFLPDGIYLNALKLGVKKLAKEMNDIINDPQRYYDFFKWHGYYSFHDSVDDDRSFVCAFCAFLNDRVRSYKRTVYRQITEWWNALTNETVLPDGFPKDFLKEYYKSIGPYK